MATGPVSANRLEILQIANAVAAEKNIDKRIVLEAMEEAIQKAARSRYGLEHDIRAEINADSGETRLWRVQTVVEEVENPVTQLTLADAKKMDSDAEIGNEFREELPPFEFGRVAAQTAKQVITGKVREAERARQYNDFKDRVGEIINGSVKRVGAAVGEGSIAIQLVHRVLALDGLEPWNAAPETSGDVAAA